MDAPLTRLNAALAGRYTVTRIIGRGGMATVYAARDLRHDRDVAIKVLESSLAESLGAERFLHEIKTTANLRHPHILPLFDSGEAGGLLFYVMPLVEGESLRDRLEREKQFPIADALRIAAEVADALSYAHARGVVHRDIKPENILLEGGHAVVADFGIARAVSAAGGERLTQTGTSMGTPAYMSPEQAAGEADTDGRSDLYSLACVLYEMLGGQPPFSGPTAASIVRQHIAVEAPPITNLRPAVPAHVAGALQRALAKSPVDRFNPVAEFSSAIQLASRAEPVTSNVAVTRTAAKSRRLMIGAAAAIVIAFGLAGASLIRARATTSHGTLTGVAVLPFSDLSPDKSNAYLGDGIAETLISALTNVTGLTTAARTSSFSFRDRQTDVREIGRALSVETVLGGSVQRAGDRLRITADLVRTSDGVTLWSQTFDRKTDDIFAVQDEVVRAVVTTLQGRMYAANANFGSSVGTTDREAYDLYLQGLYFWNRRSLSDFMRALRLFEQAIARDSTYAAPWAGVANATITQAFVDSTSPTLLLSKARTAAERARRLAPELADAHAALAYLLLLQDWDFVAADSAFRSVTAEFPRNVMGHKWFADLLLTTGRQEEMWVHLREALVLDPKLAITMYNVGSAYKSESNPDSALAWFERSLDVAPYLALSLVEVVRLHGARGDSVAMFSALERAQQASTRAGSDIDGLRRAWARGGYKAVLRALAVAPGSRNLPIERARWLAEVGDVDGAFRALDEGIARRDVWSLFIMPRRELDVLHGDPRWAAVLRKIGLPQQAAIPR